MTHQNYDQIRIRFPEGGCWEACGLGYEVYEADVQSHVSGGAPHCDLIDLIQPVIAAEPGCEPMTISDGARVWHFVGYDDDDSDTMVYAA